MNNSRSMPRWLVKRMPHSGSSLEVKEMISDLELNTVCQSAKCPNIFECFSKGTTTFMIMGDTCTRDCRFCAVPSGKPEKLDTAEPYRVAEAARRLNLKYVVITSVTRDDLTDGGSQHFVKTIGAIREVLSDVGVEVLVPDFKGDYRSIKDLVEAGPDVFNHNLETVLRLYPQVRPQASYQSSLEVLNIAKSINPGILTKSGLMVGLGERADEVIEVMDDLRKIDCDILTIGQYLQPSPSHIELKEYVHPKIFAFYKELGEEKGFKEVISAPYVRSSYNAGDIFRRLNRASSA